MVERLMILIHIEIENQLNERQGNNSMFLDETQTEREVVHGLIGTT